MTKSIQLFLCLAMILTLQNVRAETTNTVAVDTPQPMPKNGDTVNPTTQLPGTTTYPSSNYPGNTSVGLPGNPLWYFYLGNGSTWVTNKNGTVTLNGGTVDQGDGVTQTTTITIQDDGIIKIVVSTVDNNDPEVSTTVTYTGLYNAQTGKWGQFQVRD